MGMDYVIAMELVLRGTHTCQTKQSKPPASRFLKIPEWKPAVLHDSVHFVKTEGAMVEKIPNENQYT